MLQLCTLSCLSPQKHLRLELYSLQAHFELVAFAGWDTDCASIDDSIVLVALHRLATAHLRTTHRVSAWLSG